MGREIELKIHLDDPEALRSRLAKVATLLGPYHKIDTYFLGPAGAFRLRTSGGKTVACRKEKTMTEGIEVNREWEFGVDDPQSFTQFAASLGYQLWYRKEKQGTAWRWGEILIEEGRVSDLGWFAEFEVVLNDTAADDEVHRATEALGLALDRLAISRDQIEPRPYAQLLGHRMD